MSVAVKKFRENDAIGEIARVVTELTGVQFSDRHRIMISSRLRKRITDLKLRDESDYLAYFEANQSSETVVLISLLTTHHTFFFRESSHFDYLVDVSIPNMIEKVRKRGDKVLRIWSAACSKGQEVYSLSMLLAAHMPRIAPDVRYEIYGTDIDGLSVDIARQGVYPYNEIKEIPMSLVHGHWMRGTGDIAHVVKAKPALKSPCTFGEFNLISFEGVQLPKEFDVIFCRNVFIYFTTQQIKQITINLLGRLAKHGTMFIGISESLNGLALPVDVLAPSVYCHRSEKMTAHIKKVNTSQNVSKQTITGPAMMSPPKSTVEPRILRVLTVDDSSSVLMILKQTLTLDQGFQVVATAGNGIEAAAILEKMEIDIVTLDVHMPGLNGVEYLCKHFNSSHPPVVMISSASRDDGDVAMRCLEFGASDFVEKPTLRNLAQRGEEIRLKLRTAWRQKNLKLAPVRNDIMIFSADPFAKKNTPDQALRIMVAHIGDRKKLNDFFLELKGVQPPTIVLISAAPNAIPAMIKSVGKSWGPSIEFADMKLLALEAGQIQLGDFDALWPQVQTASVHRVTSVLIYGEPTTICIGRMRALSQAHISMEDFGGAAGRPDLDFADEVVPRTSFAYISTRFLNLSNGSK